MDSQHELVLRQFAPTAEAYAVSSTHNDERALARLKEFAAPKGGEVLLDVASGPGTVALLLAPLVRYTVASDLTQSMLATALRRASEQELHAFATARAAAETLPFVAGSFDLVTVRTAPHHFADVQRAVSEMARVTCVGGKVLIVDTCAPEDAELDRELNALEKIRDPSHVRNYTPSEWRGFLDQTGLNIVTEEVADHALGKRLYFREWTTRMNVPQETAEELWARFTRGSDGLKALLQVEKQGDDLTFTLPEITILATK